MSTEPAYSKTGGPPRGSVAPMYAAMAWDQEPVEGWTVMGRLRERQEYLRNRAVQAQRRQDRRQRRTNLPAVAFDGVERDAAIAGWRGSTELLALLFAPPDSSAMRVLNIRLPYFDIRSGDKWSLFFPGYYEPGAATSVRRDAYVGTPRPRGSWKFDAAGFDAIREHVARQSEGRWRYSGETDIVLIGTWLPEEGDIVVDWESLRAGVLAESGHGRSDRSLGALVESITNSFDLLLDPTEDLASLFAGESQPPRSTMRDFTAQVLSGVATALLVHGLHLR